MPLDYSKKTLSGNGVTLKEGDFLSLNGFVGNVYGPAPDAHTMIDREFSLFEWVEIDWLIEHTTKFKKDVYRTIFDTFNANLR